VALSCSGRVGNRFCRVSSGCIGPGGEGAWGRGGHSPSLVRANGLIFCDIRVLVLTASSCVFSGFPSGSEHESDQESAKGEESYAAHRPAHHEQGSGSSGTCVVNLL